MTENIENIKKIYRKSDNMVEQLIQNNNGRNNTIALDLNAIDNDGGLNQAIGGGEKQEKVILEQPTEAVISNCDLQLTDELMAVQGNPSKKYYKVRVSVTTQFTHPVTGDIVESRDNYSGLRYYPKLDGYGNPIYKNGQPELDRWWSGDAHSNNPSGFALLLDKAQTFVKAHNQKVDPDEKLPAITSYRAFFNFLNSNPKCLLKTEYPSFGNQTFTKEVIQEFVD